MQTMLPQKKQARLTLSGKTSGESIELSQFLSVISEQVAKNKKMLEFGGYGASVAVGVLWTLSKYYGQYQFSIPSNYFHSYF